MTTLPPLVQHAALLTVVEDDQSLAAGDQEEEEWCHHRHSVSVICRCVSAGLLLTTADGWRLRSPARLTSSGWPQGAGQLRGPGRRPWWHPSRHFRGQHQHCLHTQAVARGLGLGSCHYRLSLVQHVVSISALNHCPEETSVKPWILSNHLCLLIPKLITK